MADYRKLIRFGKNSHVITLPKAWVSANELSPGDSVHIEILSHDLIISPRYDEEREQNEQEYHISADAPFATIKRKIITSYVHNYTIITITGEFRPGENKRIRETVHNLMALEIIEESPKRIVAKCYLNMQDISIDNLIRKTDAIIKNMLNDLIDQVRHPERFKDIDIITNLSERDYDINRLTTLIFRSVRHLLDNPRSRPQGIMTSNLLSQWDIAQTLEKIGDDIKRASRLIDQLDEEQAKRIIIIVNTVTKHYRDLMAALYRGDAEQIYKLALKRKEMIEEIDTYQSNYEKTVTVAKAIQKVRTLFHWIHDLTYHLP